VGNDGETLVADSSTSTGLRYQSGYNGNGVINGAFDIWQRGTSIAQTAANTFFADRWSGYRGGLATGATYSRQVTGDTTNLPFIQYCNRMQRDTGNTSTQSLNTWYNFETTDSIRFAGQAITFSFYARKGANFSGDSGGNFTAYIQTGTGTDQALASGYTGQVTLITNTIQPTTTWVRYTATATVASTATQIGVQFSYNPTGTAGAADYVDITGIQVELGSVATRFKRSNGSGGTIQGELSAAQRYYWLMASGTTGILGTGLMQSATRMHQPIVFPTTMRTAPSLVATSGTNYYNFQTSGDDNFNSLTISTASPQSCYVFNNSEISGTAGQAGTTLTNNASASVAFSAEL
jgi:hypothetical protein